MPVSDAVDAEAAAWALQLVRRVGERAAVWSTAATSTSRKNVSVALNAVDDHADEAGPEWTTNVCERFLESVERVAGGGVEAGELARAVLALLGDRSADADRLQGELFDLVADFDVTALLLQLRPQLQRDVRAVERAIGRRWGAPAGARRTPPSADTGPSLCEREKRLRLRRLERLITSGDIDVQAVVEYLAQQQVDDADERQLAMHLVQEHLRAQGTTDGRRMPAGAALPARAQRTVREDVECVDVPAPPPRPDAASERLPVAEVIDARLTGLFEDTPTLNVIQSRVYPIAYGSNENMLICAPTGAGKTHIALLAIAREMLQTPPGRRWRCIYVAPMKALAGELVRKFTRRLSPLGVRVLEYTGDVRRTRRQAAEAHVLVTTPEKWDVVTRTSGDWHSQLIDPLRLLIIDEVHLLHDDRGAVLEAIVARTLRLVEVRQRGIRLVGLSATLPNSGDVAEFLRVRPDRGLFVFDGAYRPVPLQQRFLGIAERRQQGQSLAARRTRMNQVCFEQVVELLGGGHQCMVFVHARKETQRVARALLDMAAQREQRSLFLPPGAASLPREALQSVNRQLHSAEVRSLALCGVGIHHAGLLRADRLLIERLFEAGHLRLLVCTATLAWGVNLPARGVIIRGTELYDVQRGGTVDLSMLDVMQIFGRAGRPQYDTLGLGVIITARDRLPYYLRLLTQQMPIESHLLDGTALVDHLNAEVVLGSVASLHDAFEWMSYLFLAVRVGKNPLHYGVSWSELLHDRRLVAFRMRQVQDALETLHASGMIAYEGSADGELAAAAAATAVEATDLGRIASHFYVGQRTVSAWREQLRADMSSAALLRLVSAAHEFEQLALREDEVSELERLAAVACPFPMRCRRRRRRGDPESPDGDRPLVDDVSVKVNVLLQSYVSREEPVSFALLSDTAFVVQSFERLLRAILEVAIGRGYAALAVRALELARAVSQRVWAFAHPLRQVRGRVGGSGVLTESVMAILEGIGAPAQLEGLVGDVDDQHSVLAELFPNAHERRAVRTLAQSIPRIAGRCTARPLAAGLLQLVVRITPQWQWNAQLSGADERSSESWWVWVECGERVVQTQRVRIARRQACGEDDAAVLQQLLFQVVLPADANAPPPTLAVRFLSETWHGGDRCERLVALDDMRWPDEATAPTPLLDLRLLPRACVGDWPLARRVLGDIAHWNPLQTQVFHAVYHTDECLLIAAPPGSGKSTLADLVILRALRQEQHTKPVLLVAASPTLARMRAAQWREWAPATDGWRVVAVPDAEAAGDMTKWSQARKAHLVCASPSALLHCVAAASSSSSSAWLPWRWAHTVVLDDLHFLDSALSSDYEGVLTQMRRYGTASTRLVALASPVAPAATLGAWLGVPARRVWSFAPTTRPVPCAVRVRPLAAAEYTARMNIASRLVYTALCQSDEPMALVFVASRAQGYDTAWQLIRLAASGGMPRRWVRDAGLPLAAVRSASLRHVLEFGVGVLHEGSGEREWALLDRWFAQGRLAVLIAAAGVAWRLQSRAPLVAIKGSEYVDAASGRREDMPLPLLLHLLGRAGRMWMDRRALALVLVREAVADFYQAVLRRPCPLESRLMAEGSALEALLSQEVRAGRMRTPDDALVLLRHSYGWRRLSDNPAYYESRGTVESCAADRVEQALMHLATAGDVVVQARKDPTGTHLTVQTAPRG
ncbi:hypothetical protein CDCA_CDCA10G2890 [Cyanidium caldarium]|uniref:Uncharacterized protein n=1 Tax=Cyanidium caldarium TaxID=2771 RepID=A0AAV9IXP9_CYACA|nr:hypothetical protein CDCA_CDCA10G2890 [Cyanidium caldarium]